MVWCPGAPDTMAGDHGEVHVVESKGVWDDKIQSAKNQGKVVSDYFFFLSFSEACLSISPPSLTVDHQFLPLQLVAFLFDKALGSGVKKCLAHK